MGMKKGKEKHCTAIQNNFHSNEKGERKEKPSFKVKKKIIGSKKHPGGSTWLVEMGYGPTYWLVCHPCP